VSNSISEDVEWRPIKKFPGYEISDTRRVRYTLTNRTISQRMTASGYTVLLHRLGWNTECFVEEMFLLAFPEVRTRPVGRAA